MLGSHKSSNLLKHRAEDDPAGDDGNGPAPSDGNGESTGPSSPPGETSTPEPTPTPEPSSTPKPSPSSSSTPTQKPSTSKPPTQSHPSSTPSSRSTTTRTGPTQSSQPSNSHSTTPGAGDHPASSQPNDANPTSQISEPSSTGDQTLPSSSGSTPAVIPDNTRSVGSNFQQPQPSPEAGSDGLGTDPSSLGSSSQTGETDEPQSTKKSGSSKLVPILVPCLLVPIVVLALLVLLVRRSRRKHRIMVDEFTNRSMMFDGGAPLMLQRTHSYSSSHYPPSQGHSAMSHLDVSRPPMQTSPTGGAFLVPPTPRSAKFRQSDDLDIKCAGRVESSASFSALYDAYDGTSESGLPYAQGPSPQAPAAGPSFAQAPAPVPAPVAAPMSATQRRNNFFARPQFMRSSNIPPASSTGPPPPPQQQQPASTQNYDPDWARNPITGAPRLELPSFDFLQHERAGQTETPSPISAVWKSEDPFAQGSLQRFPDAPPLPSPPRVSNERRAARTRSVEQRLVLALAESSNVQV